MKTDLGLVLFFLPFLTWVITSLLELCSIPRKEISALKLKKGTKFHEIIYSLVLILTP